MDTPDLFAVFSLPRRLRIDTAALERDFYAQSRRLHPDRFAGKSAAEQEDALAASSLLNDAYRTLKDSILRTQHLLTLEGVELEEQSKAATDQARATGQEKKQVVPPDLLEEVFELNMQLMEMRSAKQMGEEADADLRNDLLAAKANFDARMATTQSELEHLWTEWDTANQTGDRAGMDAAKVAMVILLNKRSYLRNLIRDVNEALD